MQEAAKLGAFIEFTGSSLKTPDADARMGRFADAIRKVGPEFCILSSDLGQQGNALPPDGFGAFLMAQRGKGFTARKSIAWRSRTRHGCSACLDADLLPLRIRLQAMAPDRITRLRRRSGSASTRRTLESKASPTRRRSIRRSVMAGSTASRNASMSTGTHTAFRRVSRGASGARSTSSAPGTSSAWASCSHAASRHSTRRDPARSGIYSFENRPKRFAPALDRRFRANKKAWAFFQAQPPGYRRLMIFLVMSAKQDETKARRLAG